MPQINGCTEPEILVYLLLAGLEAHQLHGQKSMKVSAQADPLLHNLVPA